MIGFIRLLQFLALLGWVSASRSRNPRSHVNRAPHAAPPLVELPESGPVVSRNGTQLPPYNTTFEFDQLIDHNNPSLGTFKQRFFHTWEFYEEGGPIILFTPGEVSATGYDGYLTNSTINGQIAQQQNGSTIVLEHRFYGLSNPYNNLSVASLQVHTIQQAIDDLVYFAQNAKLPMPNGDNVTPDKAPWVLIGGSYSGALTSWTMVNKPDVFFAGYASSAVVEAITDFWQYFDPIRQFMPQNCSADVQAVISHIDDVFTHGTPAQIQTIKDNFGLGIMTHLDDVAGALRNNLWDWQSLSVTSGPHAQFFNFCDALEVKNGVSAGKGGWGVDHALTAWGSYWNSTYYSFVCGNEDAETCLGSYNSSQSFWTDITVDNSDRSWTWIVCNEVGFYQEGAPTDWPSLVTRLVQPAYDERQCTYWFPEQFKTAVAPRVGTTNAKYTGWDVNIDRLFFANGQRDPWRDATVSSDFHTRQSTNSMPIAVGDGFHCSDLITSGGTADSTILAVQTKALGFMKEWLSTFKPKKTLARRDAPTPTERIRKPINAWLRGVPTITAV
ncbi:peptidase S28 [Schizopora paradoxa]|uniref:Peptidase S28 n=1 Tax=Schizopora paradoxa TaxID=27342 RepID=A0A0H2R9D6_9AGAM|nr:peptidase S28 [Schizopora paradoxa]